MYGFRGKNVLRNMLLVTMVCGALSYHLFPIPSSVWRISFVGLCLLCIFLRGCERKISSVEVALLTFLGINFLYFIGAVSNASILSMTAMGGIFMSLTSLSAFAFLGNNNLMQPKVIAVAFFILLVASIEFFYYMRDNLLVEGMLDEDDGVTNNAGVAFVVLLPWLFLLKKKWLALSGLFVCLFFIVYSAKRGDILASIIPVGLFIYLFVREQKGWWRRCIFIISIVAVLLVGGMAFLNANEYLQQRLEDTVAGNSSGRDAIFRSAWNCWYYADDVQFWGGHGFLATIPQIGKMAHNDWLEILVDYGVLGVGVYLIIFCLFAHMIGRESNIRYRMVLLSCVSIWILKSLYSMAYLEALWAVMLAPAGMVIGWRNTGNKP